MNNSKIIYVVIALVAVFGISLFVLSQNSSPSNSMMGKHTTTLSEKSVPGEPDDEMMQKGENNSSGSETDGGSGNTGYISYSKTAFDNASSTRRVLFFYASWCPTCIAADTNISQNLDKIPSDVTLIKVNYNDPETDQEEKDLAKKYGITYQHTFVQIDSEGNEITKWNGGEIEELLSNIK